MEWFLFAPVPESVEFAALGWLSLFAQVTVLVPLWLVAREALGFRSPERGRPQLRVVEGRRELRPRTA